jgi:hypothetical protein
LEGQLLDLLIDRTPLTLTFWVLPSQTQSGNQRLPLRESEHVAPPGWKFFCPTHVIDKAIAVLVVQFSDQESGQMKDEPTRIHEPGGSIATLKMFDRDLPPIQRFIASTEF